MNIKKGERISWRLLTISEATGISVSALKRAIYNGRLRACKEGRATIVHDSDLREYLASLPPAVGGAKETTETNQ